MLLIKVLFLIFTAASAAYAQGPQDQEFPFDKPCLTYNKELFKQGEEKLIDVMIDGDFPQFCTIYSLADYQVKEEWEGGYFIVSNRADLKDPQMTEVYLKSDKPFDPKQAAFFTGNHRFILNNSHQEQEFYAFQEVDL